MTRFATGLAGRPALVLVGSFAGLIAAGTLLFSLPAATPEGGMTLADALFMATSAVCVTGLTVFDVGRELTPFGQWTLLALIQLGALGLMTFYAFAFVLIGQSMPLAQRTLVRETLGPLNRRTLTPVHMLRSVVFFTLLFEGAGAAALYPLFRRGMPPAAALESAVFHSVSAFSNAGFSLFADSFEGWRADPAMVVVIAALIVAGGLGFIAWLDLWIVGKAGFLARLRAGRSGRGWEVSTLGRERLGLHTRAVLTATGALLLAAALLFWLDFARAGGSEGGRSFLDALFLSVTSRTAGFNTVPTGALSDAALFLVMILMFIGASPGSTGGGVKTTTAFVLIMALWTRFRGYESLSAFRRTIPEDIVRRAGAILFLGAGVLAAALFLLFSIEKANPALAGLPRRFSALLFEAVSAFGTVGLSMGVTERLSEAGRMILVALMFVGRIGPLTLFVALREPPRRRLRHPDEVLMVG